MDFITPEIIKDWHLEHLSAEEQMDVLDRVGRLLYQAVLVRSLDILSAKEQGELDTLLDQEETTSADVYQFLNTKIEKFGDLVFEEREELRKTLIG